MTDLTGQLDAIQNRLDEAVPTLRNAPMDIGFLLDLARKQQAATDAVLGLCASSPDAILANRIHAAIRDALEAKP